MITSWQKGFRNHPFRQFILFNVCNSFVRFRGSSCERIQNENQNALSSALLASHVLVHASFLLMTFGHMDSCFREPSSCRYGMTKEVVRMPKLVSPVFGYERRLASGSYHARSKQNYETPSFRSGADIGPGPCLHHKHFTRPINSERGLEFNVRFASDVAGN